MGFLFGLGDAPQLKYRILPVSGFMNTGDAPQFMFFILHIQLCIWFKGYYSVCPWKSFAFGVSTGCFRERWQCEH